MGTNWQLVPPVRRARRAGLPAWAIVLAIVIGFLVGFALLGWFVMLALGALASIFGAPALAIGYFESVAVGILVRLLVGWVGGS